MSSPNDFDVENGVLIKYRGRDRDVVIPAGITSIAEEAFQYSHNLVSLTITEGVTEIGNEAFYSCEDLVSITIPSSVKNIGSSAFHGCKKLVSVAIPEGIEVIGDHSFWNCERLERVVLPDSLTRIGHGAFWNCERLTINAFPSKLKEIEDEAFWACKSLTTGTLPCGIQKIGSKAFQYCESLKDITIPSSITNIGSQAFWGCDGLTSVSISDYDAWCNIEFGDSYANPLSGNSGGCELLLNGEPIIEAIYPAHVKNPEAGLFRGCGSLEKVTFEEGVTRIGEAAFAGCKKLSSIAIPEGVKSIGEWAFNCCDSLTSIILPQSLESIEARAFSGSKNLSDITIPAHVTCIPDGCFSGCEQLKSVIIPDGVKEIGQYAFADCKQLISIELPTSIEKIGNLAFQRCENLQTVTLRGGLSNVGEHIFCGCPNFRQFNLESGSIKRNGKSAEYVDGAYYTYDESRGKILLEICKPGIEEFSVPENTAEIEESALWGTNLKKVRIPTGVKLHENCLWKKWNRNPEPLILTGSFMDVLEKLPDEYAAFYEITEKTPENVAARFFFQPGKKWQVGIAQGIQEVNQSKLIRAMRNILCCKGNEKMAGSFIDFVLNDLEKLGLEELKEAYAVIKTGGYKALKKLVLDVSFQEKWLSLSNPEQTEKPDAMNPIEELVNKNWKTTEATNKLKKIVKDGIRYKGSDEVCPPSVLVFLVNEYASQLVNPAKLPIGNYQTAYVRGLQFSEIGDQVAGALEMEQLREKLEALAYADKTFRNGFVLALARYGSGKQISHLCSEMRERANWNRHGVAGRQDVVIGRGALMLSETREAMMAVDKAGGLPYYASLRNSDADTIRDTVLSDFGFDQNGKKIYSLGGNTVSASMAKDLTLQIFDEGAGKVVKSIPKKNAEPDLYESAKADVSDLKKNIKRVINHRRDAIFEDFLSGAGQSAVKWKKVYFGNPVLRAVAKLIVWEQGGNTFTLNESGAVDSNGNPLEIEDEPDIRVAHPIELTPAAVKAWQNYFISNDLKQPFEQIWEPAYDPDSIDRDRYNGAVLPIYRFENKDQHGIHSWGLTAYSEDYGFELDDCELDAEGSTWRIVPGITDDETYTLGAFRIVQHTRKSNHIIYILDKWTIIERIEKDDSSIGVMLSSFTLAQITEFIRLANEKQCSNVLAVLMDYKNTNYEDADPFAEFTLD